MSGSGPKQRLKDLDAQLAFTLERQAIDAVVDVGANAGQYAARLRAAGWRGPILSIEPIPELRDVSPTSAVLRRIVVPQRRLDGLDLVVARPWRRLFVKVDVQGAEPAVLAGLDGHWPRVAGLQLELALLPLYDGEAPWLEPVADLAARGFAPYLLFPGYFSRALGRQVQLDVVFYRA